MCEIYSKNVRRTSIIAPSVFDFRLEINNAIFYLDDDHASHKVYHGKSVQRVAQAGVRQIDDDANDEEGGRHEVQVRIHGSQHIADAPHGRR